MKGVVFTYALTYGGALVSLFNPFVGVLVYASFSVLRPETLWHWALPQGGRFSWTIGVALLMGWVFRKFGRWELGEARGIVAAFVCFWLWSIVSAVSASNGDVAWRFVEEMAKILLPFLVGITLIDSPRRLNQLIWVLILSQGYVALELNVSYYEGINVVRTAGFFGDNNTTGIAMVTTAGLAFFAGMGAERWWQRIAAFVSTVLMIHVVLFGLSRGGMLALITLGVVAVLLMRGRLVHLGGLVIVVLLAVRLAGPEVRERFGSIFSPEGERDFSAQSRLDLWSACWDLIVKHPLLGVGPDHFPLVVHEYGWESGKEAHSLWLQTGAELGLPGLLCLALFYGLCVTRLWRVARGRSGGSDPRLRDAACMVVSSLVGFAVSVQFVSAEGLELPYYVVLVGAGALKLLSFQSHGAHVSSDSAHSAAQAPIGRPPLVSCPRS